MRSFTCRVSTEKYDGQPKTVYSVQESVTSKISVPDNINSEVVVDGCSKKERELLLDAINGLHSRVAARKAEVKM